MKTLFYPRKPETTFDQYELAQGLPKRPLLTKLSSLD